MGFDPISSLFDLGKTIIEKVIPDPGAKAAAMQKLTELQQSGDLAVIAGQVDINKIEAASSNLFIAGWRPAVGWMCTAGLGIQLVVGPLVQWGSTLAGHPVVLPPMNVELLTTLLVGMLGLGGMRTVEKLQGVQNNH